MRKTYKRLVVLLNKINDKEGRPDYGIPGRLFLKIDRVEGFPRPVYTLCMLTDSHFDLVSRPMYMDEMTGYLKGRLSHRTFEQDRAIANRLID